MDTGFLSVGSADILLAVAERSLCCTGFDIRGVNTLRGAEAAILRNIAAVSSYVSVVVPDAKMWFLFAIVTAGKGQRLGVSRLYNMQFPM